jgi:hypothetical protein
MESFHGKIIITCCHCERQLVCSETSNPLRVLAGHQTYCRKRKLENLVLLNFEDIYHDFSYDYNSGDDTIIYPFEIYNQHIYHEISEEPEICNPTYLIAQVALVDELNQKFQEPFNKHSRIIDTFGMIRQGNFLDYIEINKFVTEKGLSLAEGTDILRLFRKISIRHDVNLCIPQNMKTIRDAIDKISHRFHEVKEVDIPYPPEILKDVSNLKSVFGYYLDPLLIITEYLLNLREGDIHICPIEQTTNGGVPLIGHYASANQFLSIFHEVQELYGHDCFPLCVGINFDSMPLEALGKRSAKPLKISILNLKDSQSEENMMTIALGPELPFTDEQFLDLLSTNVKTKVKRCKALQYLKRSSSLIDIILTFL